MKKALKKLFAELLALSVVISGFMVNFSVSAYVPDERISFDDKGMLSAYEDYGRDYHTYYKFNTEKNRICFYKTVPILNRFKFVLDENLKYNDINERIIDIINDYYPNNNLSNSENDKDVEKVHISTTTYNDITTYTVTFTSEIISDSEDERVIAAKEKSNAIMHRLNDENLISAFYNIGNVHQLCTYTMIEYFSYAESDVEPIEKYLSVNNPEYQLEQGLDYCTPELFSLISSDEMRVEEYISLAVSLYEETNIIPYNIISDGLYIEECGENSLETISDNKTTITTSTTFAETTVTTVSTTVTTWITELPELIGDADGDNEITVRDCSRIAVMIAEGKSGELSENADFNKDGKVNVRDAAAIAKTLAKA